MYEETAKKFWELQKIEKTDEELTYERNLAELQRLSSSWRRRLDMVEVEGKGLAENLSELDMYREKYKKMNQWYNNLKELESCFQSYN